MLISNKKLTGIQAKIAMAYDILAYQLVGDEFFTPEQKAAISLSGILPEKKPVVELIYALVRSEASKNYNGLSAKELLTHVAPFLPSLIFVDFEQATVDQAKAAIYAAVQAAKNDAIKRISSRILTANQEFRQVSNKHVERIKSSEKLHSELLMLIPAVLTTFGRELTTSLTTFLNETIVDNAKSLGELTCYKEVVDDAHLCNWCGKFYKNKDGSPKVYSIAELQKNGVNDPSNKASWKPVIGATHTLCRCLLFHGTPK